MDDHYPQQSERLNGTIRCVEELLDNLNKMLEQDLPLAERLAVMEAAGRMALRLNSLLRNQKQMSLLVYEAEDQVKKRELQLERLQWQKNRF